MNSRNTGAYSVVNSLALRLTVLIQMSSVTFESMHAL